MKYKSTIPLQFLLGLTLSLGAGFFMFQGILPLPARTAIGIVGLVLIATSKYKLL